MRPPPPGDRTGGGPDDRAIAAFEAICDSGPASVGDYWAGLKHPKSMTLLAELVKVELNARFRRGERPRAAPYLEQFPGLRADKDRVISLVYEEFCLLEEHGGRPDSGEFCELYKSWRTSLASQLAYHRDFSMVAGKDPDPVDYPKPGERFDSYQLRSILGKGGAAQVYLATDDLLGGREVALKVSASVGREPAILASLDHRHIVPIHKVTEPTEAGLRGICMPYRPGMTLEDLIRKLVRGNPPRQARSIMAALRIDTGKLGVPDDDRWPGWSDFPARGTYCEAVAWIGLILARAIAYLHQRGVLHRDVKPANVLLAFREGPLLFDFNLAHAPNAPEQAQAALRGGTLPYMAPEQLRAFLDPAGWDEVGPAADLYALGLVLRELVTGLVPSLPDPTMKISRAINSLLSRRKAQGVPIREINPSVPPSMVSIIDRCLAFDPADRYASAEELAEDLKRFLARRPLQNAPNPSRAERASNWVSRNWRWSALPLLLGALIYASLPPRSRPAYPSRTDFREAVAAAQSDDPERSALAREALARMVREDPASAWPALQLSLARANLDDVDQRDESIKLVMLRADAEEALTWSAEAWPGSSARLKTILGALLIPKNRPKAAELSLRGAIELDPKLPGPRALLGFLKRKQEPDEAIDHYTAAIQLASINRPGPKSKEAPAKIYEWRISLLKLLLARVDATMTPDRPGVVLEGARKDLLAMGAQLEAIRREWPEVRPNLRDPLEKEMHEFLVPYYLGVLKASLARLDARQGVAPGTDPRLAEACDLLVKASGIIPAEMPGRALAADDVKRRLKAIRADLGHSQALGFSTPEAG